MSNKSLVVGGKKFSLEGLRDDDPYFTSISENFEPRFRNFCSSFLKEDFVALDIGANIGATSILLSQYLNAGKAIAIEPGKSVFKLLQKNITHNQIRNITAYNYAVSNKTQKVQFIDNSAFGFIDSSSISQNDSTVSAFTLDDLVDKLKIKRLDFIKVDIEGFEPHFFEGAKKTLKRFNPVIYFELNSWCLISHSDTNPLEFMKKVASQFQFTYRVNKNEEELSILENVGSGINEIASNLVYENIINHHSVDDVVVSNNQLLMNSPVINLPESCDSLKHSLELVRNENQLLHDERKRIFDSQLWRLATALRSVWHSVIRNKTLG